MKSIALTILYFLVAAADLYAQVYDRRYNPEYMWTSFEENFSGDQLDRKIWEPATRFKRNLGFLVDNDHTVKLEKGNLELKMLHAPDYLDSLWSRTGWNHEYSHYIGAEISTKRKFQYGVFECRAKFALQSGSWPAFWLIGDDDAPCPPGVHGSEIDIAELASVSDFPTMMHVIHRYYPSEDCDHSTQVNKNEKRYHIPRRQKYATYKCIWTPERIMYFINGKLKHEVINQGEEWFPSIPLSMILSQQVTQGYDLAQAISPVTPQTSYFDWVKVTQFFLAPEITCPDTISSEATVTMELDSLASNIEWKLTPKHLFTTTEGTGKSAQVERASNTSGPGKITFTFQMPSGEAFTSEKTFQ